MKELLAILICIAVLLIVIAFNVGYKIAYPGNVWDINRMGLCDLNKNLGKDKKESIALFVVKSDRKVYGIQATDEYDFAVVMKARKKPENQIRK